MKRRVVITGMGAVTPIGNTIEEFWDGIRSGKSGIAPITHLMHQNISKTCSRSKEFCRKRTNGL